MCIKKWVQSKAIIGDDQLLLDNGDLVFGTLAGMKDELVKLDTKTGNVEIPVEHITALICNPALVDAQKRRGLRTHTLHLVRPPLP